MVYLLALSCLCFWVVVIVHKLGVGFWYGELLVLGWVMFVWVCAV